MAGKLYQLMARLHLARSRSSSSAADVPRGHFAVYVGESRKRFVIPTAYLKHPSFVMLLKRVEDEFGFDHRCGGLTIPCTEGDFATIIGGMGSCGSAEHKLMITTGACRPSQEHRVDPTD